jgi:hypothetical protein
MTSAKLKRRQSSDTHNLAIANRTASTTWRQCSTPPLVLNLEVNRALCLWQSGHLLIHSLLPPQKIRTQPSPCCGARPFRLTILYRDNVLIGCLFDLPLVSKLQSASRKNPRLVVDNLHHVLPAIIVFKLATWRAVSVSFEMSYEQSFCEN